MRAFRYIPLMFFILLFYNVVRLIYGPQTEVVLNREVFQTTLFSGAVFVMSVNNLMVMLGVLFLFFEIFKATRSTFSSNVEHAFSMLVFIVYLIEFIVLPELGSVSFLILTIIELVDVMGGITITITAARRDIGVGG